MTRGAGSPTKRLPSTTNGRSLISHEHWTDDLIKTLPRVTILRLPKPKLTPSQVRPVHAFQERPHVGNLLIGEPKCRHLAAAHREEGTETNAVDAAVHIGQIRTEKPALTIELVTDLAAMLMPESPPAKCRLVQRICPLIAIDEDGL